jgi:hypothetical protein
MSSVRSFVCHPPISGATFIQGPLVYKELSGDESVERYYSDVLAEPTAQRTREQMQQVTSQWSHFMQQITNGEQGGIEQAINQELLDNIDYIKSIFAKIGDKLRELSVNPQMAGFLPNIFPTAPWKIKFWQHANKRGDSFDLGVITQTHPIALANPALLSQMDWDRDLTRRSGPNNGTFNDAISCVECKGPDKHWVLFEHVNFGGDRLFGYGDSLNLPENWHTKVSSIIMNSIPRLITETAISIISNS